MQKNIILLGGSNSVMGDGLQKGIQDSLINKDEFKFYNFGLGACDVIQNFYELKRKRNKKIFENAALIITESNVNDVYNVFETHEKVPLDIFYRNLSWHYKELYFLNKKVVSLLLPNEFENYRLINNMHRKLCEEYGFNCIDMQEYYEDHALQEFGKRIDWAHQLESIMQRVGKNIIDSIEIFQMPKKLTIINDNPKFFECTPKDMIVKRGKIKEDYLVNSMYGEQIYRLDSNTILAFPKKMQDCCLIGLHTWNNTREWKENFKEPKGWDECSLSYASLELCNDIHSNDTCSNAYNGGGGQSIIKETNILNCVIEVQNPFFINENTHCKISNGKASKKEYYHNAKSWEKDSHKISFCDIIAFFCATKEGNYHTETLDYEALSKENIKISTQYNYNHILPPIEKYKRLIDEVLSHRDIIIEYLIKTGAKELESSIHPTKETYKHTQNTYFNRLLHKIKHRATMPYIKHKLRKMFRV
ncbi:hypothetical protein [Helicobacter bilis]|uniref:hypothetical protein n=1 Tax=Helicobacter bilis TaxID=37372 RepID=UPI001EE8B31D|nr:hypothetical protein [Helicobacter bilis]